ncbi:MAG: sigma-70 family RNA polymerase sigma factor [Oscillospiraceae bacterium]|nr:sigma-70 family RNA polymerase sigma factor [Oscillospiraceae bacterium]
MTPNPSDNNSDRCDKLSLLSDEELAEKYRSGKPSVSYASELIYRYFGLIKSKAASMCSNPSAYDDLVQEGLLGLLNAVRCYRDDKGAGFSTFASVCIANRIRSAAAKLERQQLSEEEGGDEQAEDNADPESIIIGRELLSELYGSLSPLEYDALRYYTVGLNSREAAERLGITEKSAENAITRARKKLKGKLGKGDD